VELSTITMDPEAAKTAYEDYAAAVKANRDAEDQAIADGYRALADGKQLIQLSRTIAAGGIETIEVKSSWHNHTDVVTVPRLAICRANAEVAFTRGVDRDGGCLITANKRNPELHTHNTRDRFTIPDGTFEPATNGGLYVRAIVPNIPAAAATQARPAALHPAMGGRVGSGPTAAR
jgi:hypothetical protein